MVNKLTHRDNGNAHSVTIILNLVFIAKYRTQPSW